MVRVAPRRFDDLDMDRPDRIRIIFHAAITLAVGLLCGYPTVAESLAESERLWRTAHEELILVSVLLFAVASALPSLALEPRELKGLVWSLLATAYGFMIGLPLQAIVGERAFSPSRSPMLMVGFVGNAIGILGSMLAAALTVVGARAALAAARARADASVDARSAT
jgi:hypothetical protein